MYYIEPRNSPRVSKTFSKNLLTLKRKYDIMALLNRYCLVPLHIPYVSLVYIPIVQIGLLHIRIYTMSLSILCDRTLDIVYTRIAFCFSLSRYICNICQKTRWKRRKPLTSEYKSYKDFIIIF